MARRFETTFDVDAPPAQVWFVMQDVETMPAWTTSMTRVELDPPGSLAVGSVARITQPKLATATWTVTEVVPGESFTWESSASGTRTVGSHRVQGREGGSRVTLGVEMRGATSAAVWLLAGGLVRNYVTAEAHGLKTECEARRR